MCGFLVYTEKGDNSRIRLRGPDGTNVFTRAGLTFVHNLLSVTGDFTPQPFVDGDIVCVYNGQIYNQPFSRTDGEVLIPLYKEHGPGFASHLEGEFAIALYDFRNGLAVFATDPFKTKPLFINGIECASYRSGVGGEKAEPNEIRITNLDGRVLDRMPVRRWDLNQWKETYDDWIAAFESAVATRAKHGCFIGLSSGYDSGGIACALLNRGVDFKAYSFAGGEQAEVLAARHRLVLHERFVPDVSLMPWLKETCRQRALHDCLRRRADVDEPSGRRSDARAGDVRQGGEPRRQKGRALRPGRGRDHERLRSVARPVGAERDVSASPSALGELQLQLPGKLPDEGGIRGRSVRHREPVPVSGLPRGPGIPVAVGGGQEQALQGPSSRVPAEKRVSFRRGREARIQRQRELTG